MATRIVRRFGILFDKYLQRDLLKNVPSKCITSARPLHKDCITKLRVKTNPFTSHPVVRHLSVEPEGACEHVSVTGVGADNISLRQDGIDLRYGDYSVSLPYMWLRDHCRSDKCYNHETFQKNTDNYELSETETPVNLEFDGTILLITWPDGHVTSYNINWLLENTYHGGHKDRVEKVVWDKEIMKSMELPTVGYEEYMSSDDGLRRHLVNMTRTGFSVVTQAPPNHEGTIEVSERLSFAQETHFGKTWTFTSNNERADTAYTTLALGAHTDNTYFTCPSGIQVFHVLEHDGEGGETLLVDGQHCARCVKENNPAAFNTLTQSIVPHEYFEKELKIRSFGTVLSVHPTTGEFINIRFNPYDRSPLFTLPYEKQIEFYRSYKVLHDVVRNADNEFWLKLRPGMVLFVDNWRVMHGRSGFNGNRRVSGLYIARDDYISKVRQLGLINL